MKKGENSRSVVLFLQEDEDTSNKDTHGSRQSNMGSLHVEVCDRGTNISRSGPVVPNRRQGPTCVAPTMAAGPGDGLMISGADCSGGRPNQPD